MAIPPSADYFCKLLFVYRNSEVFTKPPPRTPFSQPRLGDQSETARPFPSPPAQAAQPLSEPPRRRWELTHFPFNWFYSFLLTVSYQFSTRFCSFCWLHGLATPRGIRAPQHDAAPPGAGLRARRGSELAAAALRSSHLTTYSGDRVTRPTLLYPAPPGHPDTSRTLGAPKRGRGTGLAGSGSLAPWQRRRQAASPPRGFASAR